MVEDDAETGPHAPIKVLVLGQSLGSGLFTSYESVTSVGVDRLIAAFRDRVGVPVEVVDATVPGTSLLRRYRRRRSWWDEDDAAPGRLLRDVMAAHDRADVILWSQGERDAEDAGLDIATYEAALRATFAHLRRTYRCLIVCNFIGRRADGHDSVTQQVHMVQKRAVDALSYVHPGAEQYHVGLTDDVHPDDAGFARIGALSGEAIAAACLAERDSYPQVRSVAAWGNVVVLHLSDGEWAVAGRRVTQPLPLSPATGESPFSVVDRQGRVVPMQELYFDPAAGEVYLVLERDITRIAKDLTAYVAYGASDTLRASQLVTDASPLRRPLRRGGMAIEVLQAQAA